MTCCVVVVVEEEEGGGGGGVLSAAKEEKGSGSGAWGNRQCFISQLALNWFQPATSLVSLPQARIYPYY